MYRRSSHPTARKMPTYGRSVRTFGASVCAFERSVRARGSVEGTLGRSVGTHGRAGDTLRRSVRIPGRPEGTAEVFACTDEPSVRIHGGSACTHESFGRASGTSERSIAPSPSAPPAVAGPLAPAGLGRNLYRDADMAARRNLRRKDAYESSSVRAQDRRDHLPADRPRSSGPVVRGSRRGQSAVGRFRSSRASAAP
mgnify:CR=1 FL=1